MGLRVIAKGRTIEIPREVEAAGPDAVKAYTEKLTTTAKKPSTGPLADPEE